MLCVIGQPCFHSRVKLILSDVGLDGMTVRNTGAMTPCPLPSLDLAGTLDEFDRTMAEIDAKLARLTTVLG